MPKKEKSSAAQGPVSRVETDRETVFYNEPADQDADVIHQIIPEIRVAKEIFQVPETAEKLKEVSRKIKVVDAAVLRSRRGGANGGRIGGGELASSASPTYSARSASSPISIPETLVDEVKHDETIISTLRKI